MLKLLFRFHLFVKTAIQRMGCDKVLYRALLSAHGEGVKLYFTEPYLYYYFSKGRCYKFVKHEQFLYNIDVLLRNMLAFYTTIGQHYH